LQKVISTAPRTKHEIKPQCGGRYRVGTGETYDTVKFRLEPAPLSVCQRAKTWGRKR
jgi:hypothetical protein